LQGGAHDLGRVDDVLLHQVGVLAALGVEAPAVLILLLDLADDDGAILARVDGDLTRRVGQGFTHDLDAGLLVVVLGADFLERLDRAQQRYAAARKNAFLNRRAGRVHGIIHAVLALLHLDLGGAADTDHRDAAGELRQPLLQLFAIVVGGGLLDLSLDLRNARLDVGFLAGAVDDRGVLLLDHHLLGAAEHVDRHVLELDAEIFTDRLAAGQDRDVLQHGLAAVTEPRCLHGRYLEAAAQLVDDEGGERLAFHVLGNDQQ